MSSSRPRWIPLIEGGGVLAFAALVSVNAVRLGRAVEETPEVLLATAGIAAGYVLADFGSGVAHWFCDTFFEEDTPGIGPFLIQSFREHHRDPQKITRHGLLELNGNSCLAVAPVCAGLLVIDPAAHPALLFLLALGASFCAGTVVTNQLHRWAHEARPNALARGLQRCRLILTPSHHAVHHAPPHRRHYCVTNGWLNVLLDRVYFFEAAERVLVALGVPRSAAAEPPVEAAGAASADLAA